MAKLIIYTAGKTNIHGFRRRDFKFEPKFNKFIWQGRELEEKEFNERVEKIMAQNDDLNPRVMISTFSEAAPDPRMPGTKEEAIADAVEFLGRHAPHVLSKPAEKDELAPAPETPVVTPPAPPKITLPPTPKNLRPAPTNRIDV